MRSIDKINILLAKNGIDGATMCRDIGLSRSAYSLWNTGKANISNANMKKIADYFHVDVTEILPDDMLGQKEPATANSDGLSDRELALIERFRAASPAVQDFVFGSLETHTPLQSAPGTGEEGK